MQEKRQRVFTMKPQNNPFVAGFIQIRRYMNPFVPNDFKVPELLETDRFSLRMLAVTDAVRDYDAIITSMEYLRTTNPFGPDNKWPPMDLTLQQDENDLKRHQKEFLNRSSFAYTVMDPDENVCLGCVYIDPSSNPGYDAEITMWVRESESKTGLDEHLFATVKRWVQDEWPFSKPGYPGREIGWKEWKFPT